MYLTMHQNFDILLFAINLMVFNLEQLAPIQKRTDDAHITDSCARLRKVLEVFNYLNPSSSSH